MFFRLRYSECADHCVAGYGFPGRLSVRAALTESVTEGARRHRTPVSWSYIPVAARAWCSRSSTNFQRQPASDVDVRYGKTAELAGVLLEEGENSPADLFYAQDPGGLGAVQAAGSAGAACPLH